MNYVFDVDGTICFNGTSINKDIIENLKKLESKNNQLIFASARPIRDLMPIVSEFKNNLLIGGNGSIIAKNNVIRVISQISRKDLKYLIQLVKDFNLHYILDGKWDYSTRISKNDSISKQLDPGHLANKVPIDSILEPIKMILLGIDGSEIVLLSEIISQHTNLELVHHVGEGNIDMTEKHINKANTLKLLGIKDYIAFGNDMNDVQMLTLAKESFWVNSKPELLGQSRNFDYLVEPNQVAAIIDDLNK